MIYESQCSKCEKVHEYSVPVAEMENTPKCCGKKTQRVIFSAPMVSPMIWTSHKATNIGGKWCETASDYKRVMKEGNYISSAEGKQEAEQVRKRRAVAEAKRLTDTVVSAYDKISDKKRKQKKAA